mmetsp:Transcript_33870/g.49796  ORF Transcript_33870/g.49796 Transcript_33870/m.49796 type:complete len:148 (+) Transcript_33870:219-662(+)
MNSNLQFQQEKEYDLHVFNHATCDATKRQTKRRMNVSFESHVTVNFIPQRSDYPHDVQRRIWCSVREMKRNKRRNKLEFAADGYNWRNVTEDEDMLMCHITGKRIHPVHFCESPERKKRLRIRHDLNTCHIPHLNQDELNILLEALG